MDVPQFKASDILPKVPRSAEEYDLRYYDFRRPDKFSMEQIRTLSIIYETFARLSAVSLSAQLRKQVKMNVVLVDQMTYGEFLATLDSPTTMGIVQYNPLICSTLIEMTPEITESICDRLYGGDGEPEAQNHELTAIGRAVIEPIFQSLLKNLGEAWKDVFDIQPALGQLEHNPQFAQILPPPEMIILVKLDVSIGDRTGEIKFCIPYLTLEPILAKLSARWYFRPRREGSRKMIQKIGNLKLESAVLCRGEKLSLKSLGQLKKGSLIALQDYKSGKGTLRMGGEKLLNIHFRKTRRNLELTMPAPTPGRSLTLKEMRSKKTPDAVENLEKQIKGLTDKIGNSINELNKKMDDVSNGQNHLNDQLLLDNPESSQPQAASGSLDFIQARDLSNLQLILQNDFPQLSALVLSRLDNELSARLLACYDDEIQSQLIRLVSSIKRVAPQVLTTISKELDQKLSLMSRSLEPEWEGINIAASILNYSSRDLERRIIGRLEKEDKGLTEKMKSKMFVFEDITQLDDDSFELLMSKIDPKDLSLPLRVIDESVRIRIMERLDAEWQKEIQNLISQSDRLKISDINEAENRIVTIFRELETEGEIKLN
jgi:flagellar motor switch protein FliM